MTNTTKATLSKYIGYRPWHIGDADRYENKTVEHIEDADNLLVADVYPNMGFANLIVEAVNKYDKWQEAREELQVLVNTADYDEDIYISADRVAAILAKLEEG